MHPLIRHTPAIIAGSALAGFGLAFGRSAYRKAKKYWFYIAILLCLIGVFFGAMWLFRNYRTFLGGLLKRLGALAMLACLAVVFYVSIGYAVPLITEHNITQNTALYYGYWLYGLLALAGSLTGLKHRRKRRQAWEAEAHNALFLDEHGLQTMDIDDEGNMRLRDVTNGVGYLLAGDLNAAGELEFEALGKPGKRAYIEYDGAGRFVSWSGLVDAY